MKQETTKGLEKDKDMLVIVEGKKDALALQELEFKNIFILNKVGKSLNEQVEKIESLASGKEVCILTDFDKRGKSLYLRLRAELSIRKIKLDNRLRSELLKEKVSHIEGLKVQDGN